MKDDILIVLIKFIKILININLFIEFIGYTLCKFKYMQK